MNAPLLPDAEHTEISSLLPWLVNGRLSDADRGRAEAHLRDCAACRDDYALECHIHGVIATAASIEQIPSAGLHKLHQRLDGAAAQDVVPRRARMVGRPLLTMAASVAVLAGALGFVAARHWPHLNGAGSADYFTVTSTPPPMSGVVIRAVFSPTVTLAQLESILKDAGLRIVSGPTEAGVYSLAMDGSGSPQASLSRLRTHEGVRFAEPVGAAPRASAP